MIAWHWGIHSKARMKEIQISKFKAQCLRLLDEVNRTGESLMITRNSKPLAVINPVPVKKTRAGFGIAKGTAKIKGDIIAPVVEPSEWEILS
jgi:prevent-host-death family protein